MVLELHVWGPAFSLPSIDAQCLAAIAYLSQAVPRGEWALIASSDPSLSPTGELPALRNGALWVGGFRNIVDYLIKYSAGQYSLDADLDGLEKADCIAYSSFVESRGQDLLDLSLYVSSQNYTTVTRPIYSKIQSFPLPYVTPPSLRSAAKSRTEHLGLSSLDIDSTDDAANKNEKSIIPETLRRPKATLQGLLSQPENASQIRLEALASSFFEPLQVLRGQKRFFLCQFLTSLDCLALGYLSLALLPDLPSPWLANCMRKKFPQLCAFVHDLQSNFFGKSVTLEDAGLVGQDENDARARGKGTLPWQVAEHGGLLAVASALGSSIVDYIPIISQLRRSSRLEEQFEDEGTEQEKSELTSMKRRELLTTISSVVAGVGFFVGFMFQQGLITISSQEQALEEKSPYDEISGGALDQYGEAGAALNALAAQMDFEVQMENDLVRQRNEASLVEVDIE